MSTGCFYYEVRLGDGQLVLGAALREKLLLRALIPSTPEDPSVHHTVHFGFKSKELFLYSEHLIIKDSPPQPKEALVGGFPPVRGFFLPGRKSTSWVMSRFTGSLPIGHTPAQDSAALHHSAHFSLSPDSFSLTNPSLA